MWKEDVWRRRNKLFQKSGCRNIYTRKAVAGKLNRKDVAGKPTRKAVAGNPTICAVPNRSHRVIEYLMNRSYLKNTIMLLLAIIFSNKFS